MKKVDNSLILRLCLPQFAVGLFTTMLNNYLIYFYQPSKESGIPNLIPQGRLVLGVLTIIGMIKAIGHIIDAVTDPQGRQTHPDDEKSRHSVRLVRAAAVFRAACARERPQRRVDRGVHVGLLLLLHALYDPAQRAHSGADPGRAGKSQRLHRQLVLLRDGQRTRLCEPADRQPVQKRRPDDAFGVENDVRHLHRHRHRAAADPGVHHPGKGLCPLDPPEHHAGAVAAARVFQQALPHRDAGAAP